jgi:G:T-mismatch repair DNA endonuclease (very short patch repair protein)
MKSRCVASCIDVGCAFASTSRWCPGSDFGPTSCSRASGSLGCFWHRCPVDGVRPQTNSEYWEAKLDRNVERDRRNAQALAEAGWDLVVVWEHEDLVAAADRIEALVRGRASRP